MSQSIQSTNQRSSYLAEMLTILKLYSRKIFKVSGLLFTCQVFCFLHFYYFSPDEDLSYIISVIYLKIILSILYYIFIYYLVKLIVERLKIGNADYLHQFFSGPIIHSIYHLETESFLGMIQNLHSISDELSYFIVEKVEKGVGSNYIQPQDVQNDPQPPSKTRNIFIAKDYPFLYNLSLYCSGFVVLSILTELADLYFLLNLLNDIFSCYF